MMPLPVHRRRQDSPSSSGAWRRVGRLQGLSTLFTFLTSLALTLGFGINFSYFRGSYRNNLFFTELAIILVSFSAMSQDLVILLTLGYERSHLALRSHNSISWSLSGLLHLLASLSMVAQLSQTCYFTSFCTLKLIGGVLQMALSFVYGLKVFLLTKEKIPNGPQEQ